MGRPGEEKLARRRRDYLRATGRPSLIKGEEFEKAREKVQAFHARGMSYAQMERQTGMSHRSFQHLAETPSRSGVWRATYNAILALRFEPPAGRVRVAPIGTIRRLQAMWAEGYPLPWLAEQMGYTRRYLQHLTHGQRGVTGVIPNTRRVVEMVFDKTDGRTPQDFGIDPRSSRFAVAFAAKREYAPRHCWDFDTIDDPDAIPEWTGACGTEQGYQIHYRERVHRFWNPDVGRHVYACPPCRVAHRLYEAQRKAVAAGEEPPREYIPKRKGRPPNKECKQGHDLTLPNAVYVRPDGSARECAICQQARRDKRKKKSDDT